MDDVNDVNKEVTAEAERSFRNMLKVFDQMAKSCDAVNMMLENRKCDSFLPQTQDASSVRGFDVKSLLGNLKNLKQMYYLPLTYRCEASRKIMDRNPDWYERIKPEVHSWQESEHVLPSEKSVERDAGMQ